SREFLGNTFMFSLLVIVIFNFTFTITNENSHLLASGILWIAFIFSGTIGLSRSFLVERENDCIYGLTLTPIDRTALYWGKFLGNLIMLTTIEAMIIPLFIVLYNLNVMEHFILMPLILILGNIGFMAVGTLVSALSVNLKAREILMPVLLLPLLIPLVIWAAGATSALIGINNMEKYYSYLNFVVAFDVIFFVASSMLFEYIMDES
ncbi:MAG: heme exporter protein CcmB, partial [Nitrospinota bacterium]